MAQWAGSHHALAWTEPTADTVVADFGDSSFSAEGMALRFYSDPDGRHRIDVTEADGSRRDYPVHSVIGIEPLQQYLLETEPGRLQSFDVVWDTEKKRWFHLYPGTDDQPGDGLHWTGPYKNWNGRCAVCHSTGYEKVYDPQTKRFSSTEVERGVGCEACHGPGGAHLDHMSAPDQDPVPPNSGFSLDIQDRAAVMEQCAGCHSRREPLTDGSPLPGTPFHDVYNLSRLAPGLYHADGQMLDEVFVYGSFLQSKMYARGVVCGDCHQPHSAELRAEGNAVCTQCHSPAGNANFPSLTRAQYDSPLHHFHEPGTPGAACKNCHMTEKVYMGNDWRADHSFQIPRPDLSAATGAPDACTSCHTDRDPAWAAARIAQWHPQSDQRGRHYGEILSAGRGNPASAYPALLALANDEDAPGLVRATALELIAQSQIAIAAASTARHLGDPDPIVRTAAALVQRLAPPQERIARLAPLLRDERRNVRITAARLLLDVPSTALPDALRLTRDQAEAELTAAIASRLDFPETHLQRAGSALMKRDFASAADAFRTATEMDPQRVEAWSMVIRIAAALGDIPGAHAALAEALAANPDDPTLHALRAQLPPQPR